MDTSPHDLSSLFLQLGLSEDPQSIAKFVEDHRPLRPETPLHGAEFWSPAQSTFLREAIAEDSDWAEAVDELDAMLR